MNFLEKTKILIGEEKLNLLSNSKICIFGLGGVGSSVIESLVRAGIGTFYLYDYDIVEETNLNRQLIATRDNIGKYKIDATKNRILGINPRAIVLASAIKITEKTIDTINFKNFDYIIDAIDDVKAKLLIIKKAKEYNVSIISSMGTANRIDPFKLKITDISKTEYCPLARKIRLELKKDGIYHLDVLNSFESPRNFINKNKDLGTISYNVIISGSLMAYHVIKNLTSKSIL